MKILVLTSVYKDSSLGNKDTSTNIVNSFTKEWIKQGHEVIVIHNSHRYPKIIHFIPKIIKKKIATFMSFQISDYVAVKEKEYDDFGVIVYRTPIKKYKPHQSPSKSQILNQTNKIKKFLEKKNFIPDVITGHWASPQMEIIYYLKEYYRCKTAIVFHGMGYLNDSNFDAKKYLSHIDKVGCRSLSQSKMIKNELKLNYNPFVCYSGIPNDYLDKYRLNVSKFDNIKKWKIVYVGRLVAYKNVDIIIKALSLIKNIEWEFTIIGEGSEKKRLETLSKELHCDNKVKFLGKISRDEVMKTMNDMHVYIMVSTNEIFGLTYLEAMASSCITIASKNGGVDGIIQNEKNGFLCLEGDVDDLYNRLIKLFSSKPKEIKQIAQCGYDDVHKYSDSNMAKQYIDNIK